MEKDKKGLSAFNASHLLLVSLVVLLASVRFFVSDSSDRYKCQSLLNEGRWLDSAHRSWQPAGCMLQSYSAPKVTECFKGRHIIFIGDSTVRQVYFAMVKHLDPTVDTLAEKHSDRTVTTKGVKFDFFWDPFLNGTKTGDFLDGRVAGGGTPTLAVVGSGIWYLRHAEAGGISAWEKKMDKLFKSVATGAEGGTVIADQVVLMPVENAIESRLSPERAATIQKDEISKMNDFLNLRLQDAKSITSRPGLAIPRVFNQLIEGLEEETQDGLHFSEPISKVQASILINLRCNDVMAKKFPFDKTCCSQYPSPNWVQILLLLVLLVWAPAGIYFYSQPHSSSTLLALFPDQKYLIPFAIFGSAVSFLFLADRTSLLLKENKQYDAITFGVLCLATLVAGVATMKPAEKDLGFLNREQTDEWKGWMQILILIYHYLGASKISGIYNPIRVLVAAYLFMSGYGHLSFFLKKADYGFKRVAAILIRLNLLVVFLAYVMDTDYLSYYFSPLVTIWFLVIWVTMWAGNKYNDRTYFLLGKLVVAAALTGVYFTLDGPLETSFQLINYVFSTSWNAKEWRFRVALDLWVVWGGMLTAFAFIKIKEARLTERMEWDTWQRYSIIASGVTMVGYFLFELTRESKFVYNVYHPYISIFPILAYAVLRNSTKYLRSTSSTFFIFFGQCSLETFILQFYIFLSADTKGIIMMIPGGPWIRPLNFIVTSIVFVFISNQVAVATGSLTEWISSSGTTKRLPVATNEYVGLEMSTPQDAARPSMLEWMSGDLRIRFAGIILGLWALNKVYPA